MDKYETCPQCERPVTKPENSLNVMVHAILLAQSKGVYTLEQSSLILDAINVIKKHFGRQQ